MKVQAHQGGSVEYLARYGSAPERIVPEPYTREMFEQTHRWMRAWDLFDPGAATRPDYGEAVLA